MATANESEGPWRSTLAKRSILHSSRVAESFQDAQRDGRAALIGYLTACDPQSGSLAHVFAACEAGLDVLELGVPCGAPSADGPVIRDAMSRALSGGATLDSVLSMARAVRARFDVPIVLMSYAEPLLKHQRDLASMLRWAGVDGVLVPDANAVQQRALELPLRAHGLDWVGLCAHDMSEAAQRDVLASASGFAYVVSSPGKTGGGVDEHARALHQRLAWARRNTKLPVAVGFGIKRPDQVRTLAAHVDGVVIGSALVEAGRRGPAALSELVSQLHEATMLRPSRLSA